MFPLRESHGLCKCLTTHVCPSLGVEPSPRGCAFPGGAGALWAGGCTARPEGLLSHDGACSLLSLGHFTSHFRVRGSSPLPPKPLSIFPPSPFCTTRRVDSDFTGESLVQSPLASGVAGTEPRRRRGRAGCICTSSGPIRAPQLPAPAAHHQRRDTRAGGKGPGHMQLAGAGSSGWWSLGSRGPRL